MTGDQVTTLAILAAALALFVAELVPLGLVGLALIVVLGLTVLDADTALASFSSPAVVLVAALYVVSASLIRTGVVASFGERVVRLGRGSETRLLVVATVAAALASSLLNNTSVVVLMMPVVLGAAQRLGIPPSRLLMPVSFAAILGGTMTLIGTSTNILVADLARGHARMEPLGFFEFLPFGALYAAFGMAYLWIFGRRLLPSRPTVTSVTGGKAFEYVTELRVPKDGLALQQVRRHAGADVRLLQIVRGEEVLDPFAPGPLAKGDVLVLRGPPEGIVALRRDLGLETLEAVPPGEAPAPHATTFAELVVTPASEIVGRTLAGLGLHRRHGVVAVALQRRGEHLRKGFAQVPLRRADVILVQGAPAAVERLRHEAGFLLLVGVEDRVPVRRRAPAALAILGGFVALAATGLASLPLLALGAALACFLTGTMSPRRALREVDWNILGLLAGSIALGAATDRTGLAALAAGGLAEATRNLGPIAVLSAIYLLTSIATEFVSNSGSAALMIPIALATADTMNVSARPFVFAVAFAASASFCTPVGYQTNAFVYGPGGYRFTDFLRVGLPLQLLLWICATVALPTFWSL